MGVDKNIQYSSLIKSSGQLREFNFWKRRNSGNSPFYEIDVVDRLGKRFFFTMVRDKDEWIIRETDIPDWINDLRKELSKAILENDF